MECRAVDKGSGGFFPSSDREKSGEKSETIASSGDDAGPCAGCCEAELATISAALVGG